MYSVSPSSIFGVGSFLLLLLLFLLFYFQLFCFSISFGSHHIRCRKRIFVKQLEDYRVKIGLNDIISRMNDKISLENRIVAVNTTIECQVEDEVNVVTKRKKERNREGKKERERESWFGITRRMRWAELGSVADRKPFPRTSYTFFSSFFVVVSLLLLLLLLLLLPFPPMHCRTENFFLLLRDTSSIFPQNDQFHNGPSVFLLFYGVPMMAAFPDFD